MAEAIELLQQVLAIRSVNSSDDEGKVAEFLADYMKKAGIDARVARIDETHANVIARIDGPADAEPVIWNGHLDTVPYGALSEWKTDPAVPVIVNGRIYARGASDMKSGLCAMVYALCDAVKKGKSFTRTIWFYGTCDEEKGGLGAKAALESEGLHGCKRMLIGEPTGLKMGTAQKGCMWLEWSVSGKTSHGAYPEQGRSAVVYGLKAADRLQAFISPHTNDLLGASTATITRIEGGVAPNMVPDRCTILMDIRFTPDLDKKMILEKAKAITAAIEKETDEDVRFECKVLNHRRAIEIVREDAFTAELEQAIKEEQIPVEETGINFFTDASILAETELDEKIILFGPGEPSMAHKPNEYVEIEKYEKAIRVLGHLI